MFTQCPRLQFYSISSISTCQQDGTWDTTHRRGCNEGPELGMAAMKLLEKINVCSSIQNLRCFAIMVFKNTCLRPAPNSNQRCSAINEKEGKDLERSIETTVNIDQKMKSHQCKKHSPKEFQAFSHFSLPLLRTHYSLCFWPLCTVQLRGTQTRFGLIFHEQSS